MRLHKTLPATVAVAALALGSHAAVAAPELTISGFGTAGYVATNTNKGEFRANPRQDKGATKSGDWGVDSRLGLQANVTFNDMFSAVGQLYISRRDGDSSPEAEWLFVQADLSNNISLRAGRMVMPTFLLSDYRHVGYAQHWIRTPVEVYAAFNTTSFDGVQAIFRHDLGSYRLTTQLSAGVSDDEEIYGWAFGTFSKTTESNDALYSANITLERGDWKARLGHTQKRDVELNVGDYTVARGDDKFTSAGFQYDNGTWLAMSEYIWRRWNVRKDIGGEYDSEAFYVTTGYRFGPVMPYVTYSQMEPQGGGYRFGGDTRKTKAIGVRWDIVRNLAFKVQYEEVSGGMGDQMMPYTEAFREAKPKTRVYSAALDFIF